MSEDPRIQIDIDDDFMSLTYVGMFTAADVRHALQEAAAKIRVPGGRWRVLSDFSQLRIADAEGQSIITQFSRENAPFVARSAVIGLSGLKRFIFDAIVRVSGRHKSLRRFETREQAEDWLKVGDGA